MLKKIFAVLIFLLFCINASAQSEDEYIVKLKNTDIPPEVYEQLSPLNERHGLYLADGEAASAFESYFEYAEKNEVVEIAEIENPNEDVVSLFSTSSLPAQYDYINAEYAWNLTTYGNEVNIAVIDTGCNSYDDFAGNLKGGYNYVDDSEDFSDENGHGTHVCGIIAGGLNKTVTGVAPKANIYALKCLKDNEGTTVSMIADAIYDAVDEFKCKVISMSIGFDNYKDIYDAIKYAYKNGVTIVAAVGNDGNKDTAYKLYYPAAYKEVVGVGCCNKNAQTGKFERASFSQKNSAVMVVAPGMSVKSTYKNGSYAYMSGTSQATPMVAASAAILLSAKGDMTPDEFMDFIENCSQPVEDDYCGNGLLDIGAMLDECIKDCEWYVSPMDTDGVTVYNNTDEPVSATAILAGTDGGEYARIAKTDIELDAKSKICLNPADMNVAKMFLWQSMNNLKPLTKVKYASE